jgi:Zn-dependent peptidase ImmA (M78 family)
LGPKAEDEANATAAELLMPESAVRAGFERYRSWSHQRTVVVHRLADEFLVSRQAMQRRLYSLGLLDAAERVR